MSSSNGTAIHWFRKGLRLHDNPALLAAIDKDGVDHYQVRPVFILDRHIKKYMKVGANRWRFLQQTLEDLDKNLRSIGTRLYVLRGYPEEVFSQVFKNWNVKKLTFEIDIEPYARKRDEMVESLAKKMGVKVVSKISHTLYNTERVVAENLGSAPLTYQRLLSVVDKMGQPALPVDRPAHLAACQIAPLEEGEHTVPSLSQLLMEAGVDISSLGECIYVGGETEALARMEKFLAKKAWVCKFEKPNTSPNSLEPSTTVLSPHLKFGSLSPRLFYYGLKKAISGCTHSKPPVSLIGQLMWREFYYVVGSATPNFDKMASNPVCCQVPWDTNAHYLDAWSHGRTGYPFIDAIMRQLRQEGWIHHLARHAVACFLTRGDLYISWEEGQAVFEELLLDADWALNAGNWMWLSASAFFHQFYRVYSPVAFGKKTDKNGDYIRKYVPEVSKLPSQYVYEPWTAPLSVQKQAGCVLGQNYPHRIIIHENVYKKNIGRMSLAYKNNKAEKDVTKVKHTKLGKKSADTDVGNSNASLKKSKIDSYFNKSNK